MGFHFAFWVGDAKSGAVGFLVFGIEKNSFLVFGAEAQNLFKPGRIPNGLLIQNLVY